jgi:hypothetical protein
MNECYTVHGIGIPYKRSITTVPFLSYFLNILTVILNSMFWGCFEGRQKSPSSRVDEAVVK